MHLESRWVCYLKWMAQYRFLVNERAWPILNVADGPAVRPMIDIPAFESPSIRHSNTKSKDSIGFTQNHCIPPHRRICDKLLVRLTPESQLLVLTLEICIKTEWMKDRNLSLRRARNVRV